MIQEFEDIKRIRDELSKVLAQFVDKDDIDALFERTLYRLREKGSDATREQMSESSGVDDFLRRLFKVKDNRILHCVGKHIKMLVKADIPSQISEADLRGPDYNKRKNFSDKLFELYFATLILPICQELEIDDPEDSSKAKKSKTGEVIKSPDIVATIDGRRWAFECKVMSSDTPKRIEGYLSLLDKSIEQLSNVATRFNLTVFSFRQQIPLNEIWPIDGDQPKVWDTYSEPLDILHSVAERIRRDFETQQFRGAFQEKIAKFDSGGIIVPATLNFLPATTSIRHNNHTPIVNLKELQLWPFGALDCDIHILGHRINDQLHLL